MSLIVCLFIFLTIDFCWCLILFGKGYAKRRYIAKADFLLDCLRNHYMTFTEGKLLYTYLSVIIAIFSVPWLLEMIAGLRLFYTNNSLAIFFDKNASIIDWTQLGLAGVVSLVYVLHIRSRWKSLPKELTDTLELINEQFNFRPNTAWFAEINAKSIKSLGDRYSPERNYPFPDMESALCAIDGKGFVRLFRKEIKEFYRVGREFSEFMSKHDIGTDIKSELNAAMLNVENIFEQQEDYKMWVTIRGQLRSLKEAVRRCVQANHIDIYSTGNDSIRHFVNATDNLINACFGEWIDHMKGPAILVTGKAGMGKSHLLADIVNKRQIRGCNSILLLGQHFTKAEDPITQMLNNLGINCSKDIFLNRLNTYGKENESKVVIFIDAINEGAGKSLWESFADQLICEIEKYPFIGLVMSARTSTRKDWVYELAKKDWIQEYQHRGFGENGYDAAEYMFASFGLEQPLWPLYLDEFRNPLFLTTYCRTQSLSLKPSLDFKNFWDIISDYCRYVNNQLAQKYNYNPAQTLVWDSMNALAALMVNSRKRYSLTYKAALSEITSVANYIENPQAFLDYMIDEGLFTIYYTDSETYIDWGFERMGDYFIAYWLIKNAQPSAWLNQDYGNLYEALSVMVPLYKGKELFEYYEGKSRSLSLDAFCDTYAWRTSLTKEGERYVNWLKENKNYELIFTLAGISVCKQGVPINASVLYEILWDISMCQRDKIWSVAVSDYGSLKDIYFDIAKWGYNASHKAIARIDDESLLLYCEALIWLFCVTDKKLRDTSTRALVNIWSCRNGILVDLLRKYKDINDPYVAERLWAACYGCVMRSRDDVFIKDVAQYIVNNVINAGCIPEHVLIRDYVTGIVRYAMHRRVDVNCASEKLSAPYSDKRIDNSVTVEDIQRSYELKYDEVDDKKYFVAHNNILTSMAPEHSKRRPLYGDFGRYTFQYCIGAYDVDVENMSNWAIKMIFDDFGYNAEDFKEFDSRTDSRFRQGNAVERIGKKYQWIALYRILALLDDTYPNLNFESSWDNPLQRVRNIDPTLSRRSVLVCDNHAVYRVPTFDLSKPDRDWLSNYTDMPDIEDYLLYTSADGSQWLNLFSYNTISLEMEDESSPSRELWVFVQAFLASADDRKEVCRRIHKYGLEGRRFIENREIYNLHSREFYWSDLFKEDVLDAGLCRRPMNLGHDRDRLSEIFLEPAYLQYQVSSENDNTSDEGFSMLLPNKCLYDGLHLRFGDKDGTWVNAAGKLVCVDNYLYSGGHSALMIRKENMMDLLRRENKVLVWPILCERMLRYGYHHSDYSQSGGYVFMDSNGFFHYRFRKYEDSEIKKLYRTFLKKLRKPFSIIKKKWFWSLGAKKELADMWPNLTEEQRLKLHERLQMLDRDED